jgi:alpha-D-ribose 1-methylphosphonate 5-triphosphate diphosphatase PhnM
MKISSFLHFFFFFFEILYTKALQQLCKYPAQINLISYISKQPWMHQFCATTLYQSVVYSKQGESAHILVLIAKTQKLKFFYFKVCLQT